ncbi:hypothetical protein [Robiginitalea marina]|uniref:Lipocalin-like domain-containing protein n=1 Tax=Robiginitalea marina TaxID=2954105 RepID=A0ABT1ATQ4_9FLAO|nr:hypothetical protein [Robiginitalea marina]MCO5723219.1 hypothetical protein [Robiginitalea marina]
MKFFKLSSYQFVILFTLILTSCSDDSGDDSINEEGVDLIVGEWLFVSENDYFCGTNEVATERLAESNRIYVYNEDGTWQEFENGNPDWTGTWESLGDGSYSFYYNDDRVTQVWELEFVDNGNTMRFGIENPCEGETQTYTVWTRQ